MELIQINLQLYTNKAFFNIYLYFKNNLKFNYKYNGS